MPRAAVRVRVLEAPNRTRWTLAHSNESTPVTATFGEVLKDSPTLPRFRINENMQVPQQQHQQPNGLYPNNHTHGQPNGEFDFHDEQDHLPRYSYDGSQYSTLSNRVSTQHQPGQWRPPSSVGGREVSNNYDGFNFDMSAQSVADRASHRISVNTGVSRATRGGVEQDSVSQHLLYETALMDSQTFEILEIGEVDALKKEHVRLNQKIEATTRKLALESKVRDAAQNLQRLYSTKNRSDSPQDPDSPKKSRSSLLGSRQRSGSRTSLGSASGEQLSPHLQQADHEVVASVKKVDQLHETMKELLDRRLYVERKLLRHTAAVLAEEANRTVESAVPGGNHSTRDFDEETLYTPNEFDGIRDILHGMPAGSSGKVKVHEEQLASVQERLEQLNYQLRDVINEASQTLGQAPSAEAVLEDSEDSAKRVEYGFARLEDNLEALQQRQQEIRERFSAVQEDNLRIQEEHSRVQEDHSRVQDELLRTKDDHSRLQEEHSRVQEDQSRGLNDQTTLQDDFLWTKDELSRVQGEHSSMQTDYLQMKGEHARTQEEHSQLQDEFSRVRDDHSRLQAEYLNIQEDHSKLQQEHSKKVEEHSRAVENQSRIEEDQHMTRTDVEEQLQLLNKQLHSALLIASESQPVPGLQPPPQPSGQGYEAQMQYLEESLMTMEQLLQQQNHSEATQKLSEYETTISGLWEILQPSGTARRPSAYSVDGEDAPSTPVVETFSLPAFNALVQNIFDRAESAKEQQDILRRQIQQQRDLNGKSESEKDREIADWQGKHAGLVQNHGTLQEELETLQQELANWMVKHQTTESEAGQSRTELMNVMNELDEMKKTLDAKQTERDAVSARQAEQVQLLETRLGDHAAAQQEMESLESEVVRLTTELTMAKAELDGAYGSRQERKGAQAAELASSSEKNEALAARNRALNDQVAQLERELTEMTGEFQELTKESIELEKEREQLDALIDGLRERCETLEGQLGEEKLRWVGMRSPTAGVGAGSPGGQPGGGPREGTSMMVLRQEFKKMMRDQRAEGMRALRVC